MSFFSRLRGLFSRKEKASEPAHDREQPVETAAMRAAAAVAAGRMDDALAAMRSARDTEDEAEVLDAILLSLPEIDPTQSSALPHGDELILLVADILVARGDRARACEQLRRARSTAAKVLRADLLCEGVDGAATPEELDLALKLLSDVLRDDIDFPGARDRWERLRERMGRGGEKNQATIGATLLVDGPALPFTLVSEVARGGSGVVYRARSAIGPIERTVALKLAHQRSIARTYLAHEARIAVRFRGPGVVPILDVDPEEGWLAMAWAAGGSLRARLRSGERERAPRWLHALIATLADIHRDGWIHGDLKPANVLFDQDDGAWLGDFALARQRGEPATAGSAGYVSPERLGGASCDPRDDVFALGKILSEASTDESLARVASACVAPAAQRPPDASEVLALLR